MFIQKGQLNDVSKYFSFEYIEKHKDKIDIIAEGGNDNGKTFSGAFLVKLPYKGVFKFEDGKLIRKVK